jgi:hypothetical protein
VRADEADYTADPYQPTGALWIGSRYAGYVGNSEIASTLIYDRVLSASEMRALFYEVKAGYPNLFNRGRRSYAAAVAPGGLSIPVAMHHYAKNIKAA